VFGRLVVASFEADFSGRRFSASSKRSNPAKTEEPKSDDDECRGAAGKVALPGPDEERSRGRRGDDRKGKLEGGTRLQEMAHAVSAATRDARTVRYQRPAPRLAFAVIQRRGSNTGAA
jgi:hypothetical protein